MSPSLLIRTFMTLPMGHEQQGVATSEISAVSPGCTLRSGFSHFCLLKLWQLGRSYVRVLSSALTVKEWHEC